MNRVLVFLLLLPFHFAFAGYNYGPEFDFLPVYRPDSLYETAGKAIASMDGKASVTSPVTILITANQLVMLKVDKNGMALIYGAPVPNSRDLVGKPFADVASEVGIRFETVHNYVLAAANAISRKFDVKVFEYASPKMEEAGAMTTVALPLNPDLSQQELSQFMNLLVQNSKVCWASLVDLQSR